MTELADISGTAFIIAVFREMGSRVVDPLYDDSVVELFLDDGVRSRAGEVARTFPPAVDMIQIRTKYFDDVLSDQILAGCRQVVLLGSGLDTRAIRKNGKDVIYFEIDNRETLELKQGRLSTHGLTPNVRYIPGDYLEDGLIALLESERFDFDAPTYLLWEGNSTYLRREDVKLVIKTIRDHIPHFTLSFDYMSARVIARTTGFTDLDGYMDQFEKMGAPWLSGFENAEQVVKELGLRVLHDFSTAELHERYRPARFLKSKLFNFYFVCTVQNR